MTPAGGVKDPCAHSTNSPADFDRDRSLIGVTERRATGAVEAAEEARKESRAVETRGASLAVVAAARFGSGDTGGLSGTDSNGAAP